MANRWNFWAELEGRPGFRNMAIDQALLERAATRGERWLRLYRWSPGCLSFGRHEPAARRYDRALTERLRLDAVRRPTGGRAVWHQDELTYAVALPLAGLGGIREVCAEIHGMIARALEDLGVAVERAPPVRPPGPAAGACFAAAVGGELTVGGRKVVGSAQLRDRGALLQHGSILLGGGQWRVDEVVRGRAAQAPARSAVPPLGLALEAERLAQALGHAAAGCWPGDWRVIAHPADLLAEAGELEPRFRSPSWTWQA
jgi:lipoyl(octanoyl) transferase